MKCEVIRRNLYVLTVLVLLLGLVLYFSTTPMASAADQEAWAGWVEVVHNGGGDLYDVSAVDANTAWAVGINADNGIMKTTDGGATWQNQYTIGSGNCLFSISAVDANTAWAVGGDLILKTTDGGSNWVQQYSGTLGWFSSISAVNANNAWAAGGPVLKTTDGVNWVEARPYNPATYFMGVSAPNRKTVWAVGTSGTIVKTTNGGVTWMAHASKTTSNLHAVSAVNAKTAWAAGSPAAVLRIKGPRASGCGTGGGMAAVMLGLTLGLLSVAGSQRIRKRFLMRLQQVR